MKRFVKDCDDPQSSAAAKRTAGAALDTAKRTAGAALDNDSESPPAKKVRRSERTVTPEKTDGLDLSPPNGADHWTKTTFLSAVRGLIGSGQVSLFVEGVLEESGPLILGKETFFSAHSIYKMYDSSCL